MHFCCATERKGSDLGPCFPLAFAGEGEKVRIVFFRGGGTTRERLLSMGICQDDEIMIVQKHEGGAVLIAKGSNRIALGGGMPHKINVIRC